MSTRIWTELFSTTLVSFSVVFNWRLNRESFIQKSRKLELLHSHWSILQFSLALFVNLRSLSIRTGCSYPDRLRQMSQEVCNKSIEHRFCSVRFIIACCLDKTHIVQTRDHWLLLGRQRRLRRCRRRKPWFDSCSLWSSHSSTFHFESSLRLVSRIKQWIAVFCACINISQIRWNTNIFYYVLFHRSAELITSCSSYSFRIGCTSSTCSFHTLTFVVSFLIYAIGPWSLCIHFLFNWSPCKDLPYMALLVGRTTNYSILVACFRSSRPFD